MAPPGGATRGEHRVTCRELVVLLTGTAEVQVTGPDGATTGHPLDTAGSTLLLEVGEWVVYRLSDAASVLVLADVEYTP